MTTLGWIGALLVVASMTMRDQWRFRAVNLLAAVLLVVVNASLGIAAMVCLNAVIAAVDVYHLARLRRTGGSMTGAAGSEAVSAARSTAGSSAR